MEPTLSNVERAILSQLSNADSDLVRRVTENNQILVHNYRTETHRVCTCGLLGCEQNFSITLIPNQALYPRFCENHRAPFRRKVFLEQRKSTIREIRVFKAVLAPHSESPSGESLL